MEALLAISFLCQVATSKLGWSPQDVDKYQLACQQSYIKCYEEKMKTEPIPAQNDPRIWQGKLKSCVLEKVIK